MDFLSKNRTTIENRFPALFTSRSSINVPSFDVPTVDVPSVTVPSVDSTDVLFKIWRWINNNSVARTVVGNAIFSDASPQLMAQSLAILSVKTMAIFAATIGVYFLAKFGIKKHQMYFTMINDHLQQLNPKRLWKLIIEIVNKLIDRTKVTIEQEQNTGRDSKLANEFERFKATMQRWLLKWKRKSKIEENTEENANENANKNTNENVGLTNNEQEEQKRMESIDAKKQKEQFDDKFSLNFLKNDDIVQFCMSKIYKNPDMFILDPLTLLIVLLMKDLILTFDFQVESHRDNVIINVIESVLNPLFDGQVLTKYTMQKWLEIFNEWHSKIIKSVIKDADIDKFCNRDNDSSLSNCAKDVDALAQSNVIRILVASPTLYSSILQTNNIDQSYIYDLSLWQSLIAFFCLRVTLSADIIAHVTDKYPDYYSSKLQDRAIKFTQILKERSLNAKDVLQRLSYAESTGQKDWQIE